jgi:hypothetical protein
MIDLDLTYLIEEDYKFNKNNMQNGILKLSWVNVQSALVYGFISLALEIIKVGNIFTLDAKNLANVFVMAILASIVKNLLTTNSGTFAGIKVIDQTQ